MLTNSEIERKYQEKLKYSHKCECGHTVVIVNKSGRAECSNCHRLVFKDEQTKFKYIMNKKLIRERRKINER